MGSESGEGSGTPAPLRNGAGAGLAGRLNIFEGRQQTEQLQTTLEKHIRRVNQLLGERDRLAALLAARDAEVARLNRELGALRAREASHQERHLSLLAGARRLLEQLRPKPNPAARTATASPQPHQGAPRSGGGRLVPWAKDRPPQGVLAVVVFGLERAEIERVLDVVERHCAEQQIAPLLLTDNDSFEIFRNRRAVVEFLPARSEQERFAPELDWRLYTLRRLALIRRKWQPVRVVAFGRRAAEVVKLWRESPFEETPIPAALNGSVAGAECFQSAA